SIQASSTSVPSFQIPACPSLAAPAATSNFWQGCDPEVRGKLESLYAEILQQMKLAPENFFVATVEAPAAEYFKRWEKRDAHARLLTDAVGFSKISETTPSGKKRSLLMPPGSFEAFFSQVVASIRTLPGPHLLPAIAFVRKDLADSQVTQLKTLGDIIYITPGVDPWPNPNDWVLAEDKKFQVKHGIWRASMAKLRMPFGLQMFHHDLGHVTELFETGMMAAIIDYYTKTTANIDEKFAAHLDRGPVDFETPASLHYARLAALAEDFSLPNQQASELIKASLGKDLLPAGLPLPTPEELADQLSEKISPRSLLRTAAFIVRDQGLLFLRVGGGTRDLSNLPVHLTPSLVEQKVRNRLSGQRAYVAPSAQNGFVKTLLHESLFGIAKEIEFLISCHSRPNSSNCLVLNAHKTTAIAQIAFAIARLQLASEASHRLSLTPASAFAVGTEIPQRPDNILKRYFSAFAGKISLLHFIFVDNPIDHPRAI
ncbi:MAG: hypothetical protein K2X47_15555, partial [Bdellovibrionales bacterium]|nr:hypothetical protein [Bdellovibrionales bacterium]